MKTTIEIADNLLIRAKNRAREKKITLRSLIEESLATTLDQPLPSKRVVPVSFKAFTTESKSYGRRIAIFRLFRIFPA